MKPTKLLLIALLFLLGVTSGFSQINGLRIEDPGFQNLQLSPDPYSWAVFETDPSGVLATSGEFRYIASLVQSGAADPIFGTTPYQPPFFYNTAADTFFVNDGTAWQPIGAETVTVGAIGDGTPNDAVNDPAAPVQGDTYFDVDNQRQYTYTSAGAWQIDFETPEQVTVGAIGDGTPTDAVNDPVNPNAGDTYFDIDNDKQYTYTTAGAWQIDFGGTETVTVGGIGDGTPTDAVNDPVTPASGDTYFDVDNDREYTFTGTVWRIDSRETVTLGAIGDGPPNDATNDPANPQEGDTYFDVDANQQWTYDADSATWSTANKACEIVTANSVTNVNTITIAIPAGYTADNFVGHMLRRNAAGIELAVSDYRVVGATLVFELSGVPVTTGGHTLRTRFENP